MTQYWTLGRCAGARRRRRVHCACVPAFPEIVTYGKDEREALAMAKDAIDLVIADLCGSRRAATQWRTCSRIREVTVTLAA